MSRSVCVVLGANGFVGSHLVDSLVDTGKYDVVAVDRYSRPAQFKPSSRVRTVKLDLAKDDLEDQIRTSDYVIHCFSATTPATADADPYADIQHLQRNVEIFEQCFKARVKKTVFISSGGAVYGDISESKMVRESDMPMPISPYGICKLSIEHYLEYFKRRYGGEYVVYRLANPYGPRQVLKHHQGVIPAFLDNVLHGREINIFGDGNASRDFIYVEDATAMIVKTFALPNKHPVYNVGSGEQTTLNDILEALKDVFNREISVKYSPAPKTFLQKTNISMSRFKEEFGEPATTPFQKGLLKTVEAAAHKTTPLYNEVGVE